MTRKFYEPCDPIENLEIGVIIEVDGTHIIAELDSQIAELSRIYGGNLYPIGQFGSIISIHYGRSKIYGFVSRLRMKSDYQIERGLSQNSTQNSRIIEIDLFGEAEWINSGKDNDLNWILKFERGISIFPLPQQKVYLTPKTELKYIFGENKGAAIQIGEHVGSGGTPAYLDINELLGKHTAILGSTGSGKSGAVAAIVHQIMSRGDIKHYEYWYPQIFIIDPHNEYEESFPDCHRLSTDEGTLRLPYWLLNLQESISLFIGKSEHAATKQTTILKDTLNQARKEGASIISIDSDAITVDSPVPYSLNRLIELIKGDGKTDSHISLLNKIDILKRDERMSFLLNEWDRKSDPFPQIINQFFGEKPKIFDLSGVPNEIAGIASSIIARTIFSIKLWQTPNQRTQSPVILICEEAHRYVPNKGEAQYEAAQESIQRIAKEGRKYGIGLILVSQRPSEIDSTVLSQCNSWIVLRLTNETDRNTVRAILPDSLTGLTKILSGLRRSEAILVGQATMIPSRILINKLDSSKLPRSHDIDFDKGWQNLPINATEISDVVKRWRVQCRK